MSKKTPQLPHVALAIAALGVELSADAPRDFRVIPAGEFRAWDGRPAECAAWVCLEEDGRRIIAELAARHSPRVIDYEHATLHAKKNGGKAPAAGWFAAAEWRADGLWLIGVDWTALAAQEVADKVYRFVSPVFSYNPKTGRVGSLLHAALTNDPALDGLTDLAALAASLLLTPPLEEKPMDELLEQLRWLLNLPLGATAEDVIAQLQELMDQVKGDGTAAASFDLSAHLAGQTAQIATLSAQLETPDPAKFVPVASLSAAQTEHATAISALQAEHATAQGTIAALTAQIDGDKLDKVVTAALTAGKLTPATEPWARDLGKKDLAALSAFVAAAPVVVAPNETQTGGKKPVGQLDSTDAQATANAALAYQVEQAGKGINISTVQAVAHVSKKEG